MSACTPPAPMCPKAVQGSHSDQSSAQLDDDRHSFLYFCVDHLYSPSQIQRNMAQQSANCYHVAFRICSQAQLVKMTKWTAHLYYIEP